MDVLTEWLIRGVEVGEEADEGKDGEKDGEGAVSRRDESGDHCVFSGGAVFLWRIEHTPCLLVDYSK